MTAETRRAGVVARIRSYGLPPGRRRSVRFAAADVVRNEPQRSKSQPYGVVEESMFSRALSKTIHLADVHLELTSRHKRREANGKTEDLLRPPCKMRRKTRHGDRGRKSTKPVKGGAPPVEKIIWTVFKKKGGPCEAVSRRKPKITSERRRRRHGSRVEAGRKVYGVDHPPFFKAG